MNLAESTIIKRFGSGDVHAFRQIYVLYFRQIRYHILKIVQDGADADDLTATVFAKLWNNRHLNFDTLSRIRAFLWVMARNASLDHLRQQRRQNSNEEEARYMLALPAEERSICEEIEEELLDHLFKKLAALPQQSRKIMQMSFVQGVRNAEIAKQLGIQIQTVKNVKCSAIKLLRKDPYSSKLMELYAQQSCR